MERRRASDGVMRRRGEVENGETKCYGDEKEGCSTVLESGT